MSTKERVKEMTELINYRQGYKKVGVYTPRHAQDSPKFLSHFNGDRALAVFHSGDMRFVYPYKFSEFRLGKAGVF